MWGERATPGAVQRRDLGMGCTQGTQAGELLWMGTSKVVVQMVVAHQLAAFLDACEHFPEGLSGYVGSLQPCMPACSGHHPSVHHCMSGVHCLSYNMQDAEMAHSATFEARADPIS